jgi:hypothetical protein
MPNVHVPKNHCCQVRVRRRPRLLRDRARRLELRTDMLKSMAKQVARIAGLRAAEAEKWSHTVQGYYPVHPQPRWGHGAPPNPYLLSVLEEGRARYRAALAELEMQRDILHQIQHTPPLGGTAPSWDNPWFSVLDAASLVGFMLSRRPRRYLEIGSGNSTLFARYAAEAGALATTIWSLDPMPRREIDDLCDHVIREPLENCDLAVFDGIGPGDVVFFDGSHRVFTNSDVTTFFCDVLPRLKPGVLVHIHDIFLPSDYPLAWNRRLYSEQYLLAAMLLCRNPPFRTILPNYFVCNDPALSADVRRIFQASKSGRRDIPFFYNTSSLPGVSFWLEVTGTRDPSGPDRNMLSNSD